MLRCPLCKCMKFCSLFWMTNFLSFCISYLSHFFSGLPKIWQLTIFLNFNKRTRFGLVSSTYNWLQIQRLYHWCLQSETCWLIVNKNRWRINECFLLTRSNHSMWINSDSLTILNQLVLIHFHIIFLLAFQPL